MLNFRGVHVFVSNSLKGSWLTERQRMMFCVSFITSSEESLGSTTPLKKLTWNMSSWRFGSDDLPV